MLKLLSTDSTLRASLDLSKMDYIQSRLTNNITRVVNFYREKMRPVPSNHPLVRLLESFIVYTSTPQERWVDAANGQAASLARQVGFGSAISPLTFRPGIFYGANVKELIYVDTSYDYYDLVKEFRDNNLSSWKDITPVTVLTHPQTDMSYQLAANKGHSDESGYAVIKINVAALIFQFQYWRKSQANVQNGTRQTTAQFVGMYLIPNMIRSHIDVAWFNRLNAHVLGFKPAPHRRLVSIALPDTMTYVDNVLSNLADIIQRRQFPLDALWASLPLATRDGTFKDFFKLPHLPPTRFAQSFKLVATLPWLEFMFAVDAVHSSTVNNKYYVELSIVLARLRTERVLDTIQGDTSYLANRLQKGITAYV